MADRNLVLFGILKTKKEVYKLTKERISIGRNRTSQIVLNNNTISKDHAIIEFDQDGNAIIKHLNSSNGTYVNGQRLKFNPVRLKTGDKITFGKYDAEFTFEAFNMNNGDSKTEADINQYMINGNNSINNINNFTNNENNNNNRIIFDKKINLVNENEISFARMNHFQNSNTVNTLTKNTNNLKIEENNENNERLLQSKIEELEKKNSDIENEKEDLAKKNMELTDDLNKKITELKKMTNLFDELNEEYSKLNAKHNALMVYASDIQKKLDLNNIELSQLKNKCHSNEETDKIINEKEKVISILQNEINYYKKLCGKHYFS
jgi:pSer/pThr/pTyr-binding forkhead associated (FHA) protein